MFAQLSREPFPIPVWVVVGAGTGGTCATIGRYMRLHKYHTRLCVVDPELGVLRRLEEPGSRSHRRRLEDRRDRPPASRAQLRIRRWSTG